MLRVVSAVLLLRCSRRSQRIGCCLAIDAIIRVSIGLNNQAREAVAGKGRLLYLNISRPEK
jgi:hypothetical protein